VELPKMAKLTLKKKSTNTLSLGRKKPILGQKKLTLKKKEAVLLVVEKLPEKKKVKLVEPDIDKKAVAPEEPEEKNITPEKPAPKQKLEASKEVKRRRLNHRLKKDSEIWRRKMPLEKGVLDALFERYEGKFSRKVMRIIIRRHTLQEKYIKNTARGGNRFSLDGVATGEVTHKDREYAFSVIKERKFALSLC
jgi:hypothetical protein